MEGPGLLRGAPSPLPSAEGSPLLSRLGTLVLVGMRKMLVMFLSSQATSPENLIYHLPAMTAVIYPCKNNHNVEYNCIDRKVPHHIISLWAQLMR
jgi:hypothetical protein